LAMGFYHYWGHRDYDRALAEFTTTGRMLPSNADVIEAIGLVQRRQGKWQEAVASLRRAAELDPLSYGNLIELGESLFQIRDYPEAERLAARAITLAPDLPGGYLNKMSTYMYWEGHVGQLNGVMRDAVSHVEFGKLMAEAGAWGGAWFAADSTYRAELAALSP